VPLLPLVSDRSCGSWPLRERIPRSFHVQCRSFLRKRLCQWLSLRMMVPINDQQCSPRNFYDFESANAHSTGSRTDYSALRMTPRILAALYLLTCECYRWREHYAAQHRVFLQLQSSQGRDQLPGSQFLVRARRPRPRSASPSSNHVDYVPGIEWHSRQRRVRYFRQRLSERTTAALQAKRASGAKLGNPTNLEVAGSIGRIAQVRAADEFATDLIPVIQAVRNAGANTLSEIARTLNGRGIRPARGNNWHRSSVRNLIARIE
jgi:hypothetical protein